MATEQINQELEDAAKDHARYGGPFSTHKQNYEYMFKQGANWKTEQLVKEIESRTEVIKEYQKAIDQSANDAIKMLQWLVNQDKAILLHEGVIQHKANAKELSKQLYELWQENQKKSMMS